MTKEELESEFQECFDNATHASDGGYGADTTSRNRLWKEFSPKIDQYVKQEVIAELQYLLQINCHPEYLKELIAEHIEDIKNPKAP
jgi:hypothetical protein